MPLRTNVILKLQDKNLCERIITAVKNQYNKKYIQQTYNVTRRELERIVEYYDTNNI